MRFLSNYGLRGHFWCMKHFSNLLLKRVADFNRCGVSNLCCLLLRFSLLRFFNNFSHGINGNEWRLWLNVFCFCRNRCGCGLFCNGFVSSRNNSRLFVDRGINGGRLFCDHRGDFGQIFRLRLRVLYRGCLFCCRSFNCRRFCNRSDNCRFMAFIRRAADAVCGCYGCSSVWRINVSVAVSRYQGVTRFFMRFVIATLCYRICDPHLARRHFW